GHANFVNSELRREPNDTLDFLESENLGFRFPLAGDRRPRRGIVQCVEFDSVKARRFLRLRQAVKAAEVATVGDTDPQLAHDAARSEEHTSELQSLRHLVCRLLLEKK